MLLSLVTGFGHIYLRHYILGAFLFSLFVAGLDGIFLGAVIESNKAFAYFIYRASVPFTIAVWAFGLVHAWHISYGTDRSKLRLERAKLFREGLTAYLRDDLDAAARCLESCVDRDVDWEDPDALFHLGVVELRRAERHAERGERRAAERARRRGARAFRMCLAHDDRKKWRGEIAHEQARARLEHGPSRHVKTRRVGADSSGDRPASIALALASDSTRVPAAPATSPAPASAAEPRP
jgi:hypothetical protein